MYLVALTKRLGPKQHGFIDDKRRQETPHMVDCTGLNDEDLVWNRYVSELHERRDWCRQFCRDDWEIEPLRDRKMRLVGRRFRFRNRVDALCFILRFRLKPVQH